MKGPISRRRVGKYPRVSIDLPIEYREMLNSRLHTGVIGNLSDMGLLFHSHHEMSVGTTLRTRVMFTDRYALADFEVIVKIVWKDFYIKGFYLEYKYGAEFTYISDENWEKLNRVLRQSLEKLIETGNSSAPRRQPNSP